MAAATIRHADATHSVSNFTKSLVTDLVSDVHPYVVPPSIDVDEYAAARDQHRTVSGKVTTICRLVDRKNVSTLIEAWERIDGSLDDAELVVIGEGPNKERLIRRGSELESVQFTGWVDHETKLRHLSESEVFVLVPRRFGYDVEGFGIVYIEAQATGTPVIGSRHGGVPEAVGDGGIIIDNETDAELLAAEIREFLNNRKLKSRYQSQVISRVEQFDIQTVAQQHIRKYICFG